MIHSKLIYIARIAAVMAVMAGCSFLMSGAQSPRHNFIDSFNDGEVSERSADSTAIDHDRESVGLVLSGGGAKGIAHVGIIKALEENDIPIDYVAGTSMGAIVGSLYCCG